MSAILFFAALGYVEHSGPLLCPGDALTLQSLSDLIDVTYVHHPRREAVGAPVPVRQRRKLSAKTKIHREYSFTLPAGKRKSQRERLGGHILPPLDRERSEHVCHDKSNPI